MSLRSRNIVIALAAFLLSAVMATASPCLAAENTIGVIMTGDIPYYRGNALPSRPAHDVNASVACSWRSLRATYELHYVSANWLDRANFREAPARDLHSLAVTLRMPVDGVSLSVEGRNLTDEHATDVAGFPLPGRSVYSTISYRH